MAASASAIRASGSRSWVISRTPNETCRGADQSPNRRGSASTARARDAALGLRRRLIGLDQDHRELVAAHPADDVAVADIGLETFGHRLQAGVARRMAEAVVDSLQVVEVKIDQAGGRSVALGEGADAAEFPHQGAAVEQRRQGIAVGQVLDLGQPPLQPPDFTAQVVDLAEQGLDRALHRRRHLDFADAEERGGVHGRGWARLGARRRQGAFAHRRKRLVARAGDLHGHHPNRA